MYHGDIAVTNKPATEESDRDQGGWQLEKLAVVEQFCYLGSYVTRNMDMEQKSTAASVALLAASENCETGSAREKRKLRLEKKIADYNACVLSTCCRDPRCGQPKRSRSPHLRHSI